MSFRRSTVVLLLSPKRHVRNLLLLHYPLPLFLEISSLVLLCFDSNFLTFCGVFSFFSLLGIEKKL